MADEPSAVTPREIVPAGTSVVREAFDAREIAIGTELAAGVDFESQLKAAMILAARKPRRVDVFRLRMLEDCKDLTFAAAALYQKPVGKKKDPKTGEWVQEYAINFSVRFIEAALRAFGNTRVFEWVTYEDAQRAKIHVLVMDVEDNNGYGTDRVIEKVVERRQPQGRTVRGQRPNSFGDTVFLVDATADEFRNLWGAERSKLRRDNAQRLLPFHILAQCRAQIEKTVADHSIKHPDEARNQVLDAFYALGITPEEIEQYMDKPVKGMLEPDLKELRAIYTGLKEGEYTWAELVRMKAEPAEQAAGAAIEKPSKLKDHILAKHEKQQKLVPEEGKP
jgi:hypothetical protein